MALKSKSYGGTVHIVAPDFILVAKTSGIIRSSIGMIYILNKRRIQIA